MKSKDHPELSIITVTYNSSAQIKPYFDSLKKYIFPKINTRLIVVDNHSSDETVSLLESLAIDYPQLTVFRNPRNLGFAAANNQAARIALAPYLLFLNPDTRLLDSSLLRLITQLENNPKIGLIAPALLDPQKHPQPSVYPPQTLSNAFFEFFLNRKTFSALAPPERTEVFAVSGAAMLLKKNFFDRLGAWNEKYFMYFEDLDLCDRIRKAGKKVVYFPSVKVIHEIGSSGHSLGQKPSRWLIQSSKKYHGVVKYYLLTLIIYLGRKCQKLKKQ
jgi:GT2 family glycosyltransferase